MVASGHTMRTDGLMVMHSHGGLRVVWLSTQKLVPLQVRCPFSKVHVTVCIFTFPIFIFFENQHIWALQVFIPELVKALSSR